MNDGKGSKIGTWLIIIMIGGLLFVCGLGQINFNQQKAADQKFDAVAKIADKEADAIIEQAKALSEQAKAIGVQAETNAKAVDQIIETSEDNASMSKGFMIMAGVVAFLVLLVLILLGNRKVAQNG